MIISFFEEYPTSQNLSKLKYVNWKTKLYLAARTKKEFEKMKKRVDNKYVVEYIWWPILKEEEGYWISPFSKRHALKRIFKEAKNVPIMIDAELPTRHNPVLYITQLFNFFRNRSLIRKFIKKHNTVYSAEYYPQGKRKDALLSFLGLHFDPTRFECNVIKMIYHSMHAFNERHIQDQLKQGVQMHGSKYMVGYGTIATGVMGNEPLLSYDQLAKDLQIAREAKISEVVMFRLGGLTPQYAKVMKRFASQ